MAASTVISRVFTASFCSTMSLAMASTCASLVMAHRLVVRDVEAQAVGLDQRALLRHMGAERDAQRLVQQMRGRMMNAVAASGAHDRP